MSACDDCRNMGVSDVFPPPTSGPAGVRRASQYAAYRHNGSKEPALVNGHRGSHGCVSSDHSNAPIFPHQLSCQAAETRNDTANTAAALTRKRKAQAQDADVAVIDLTGDSPPSTAPKRQRPSATTKSTRASVNGSTSSHRDTARDAGTGHGATKHTSSQPHENAKTKPKSTAKHAGEWRPENMSEGGKSHAADSTKKKPKKKAKQDGETRLRRWRKHAPSAYREVRDRALTQRMFALDRLRSNDNPEHPSETISLAGTTGNVYTIVVDKVPSCDCPHAKKGNQCKHLVYCLSRILRAPADLEYQLAFTSSELKDIFANAPPLPSETANDDAKDGNRKPVEGECPICCSDFEPDSSETIVYCKAACGNNIHKDCFGQWAATKTGQTITCPFCRSPWQGDEIKLKEVAKSGAKNAEGYVNVASQLGLSGRRDYSTYNSFWVRGQARRGQIAWDEDGVMDHEY